MQARAQAKNIRISPQKARLVTRMIHGSSVGEAQRVLHFTPKKAARIVEKVLASAVANARVQGVSSSELRVVEAKADEGMRLKRFKPEARGRAGRRTHRYSHITVTVGVTDTSDE